MRDLNFYCQYLGLKALIFAIRLMPWSFALKFGELLGSALTLIIRKRYLRTKEDIRKAFPEKSEKEVDYIALESWRNIGRLSAEFVKAAYMKDEDVLSKVELIGMEEVAAQNAAGKGCILHLGHFTNWEIAGLIVSILFKNVCFIAKPQTNPYVDKEVNRLRSIRGARYISAYNPFFSCFKALKKGGLISILSDQSVHASKLYMPFLGRAAEVAPLTAVLSLKAQVPVYAIRIYRRGKKIIVERTDTFLPPQIEYSHKAVYDYTVLLKSKLEDYIKMAPETWLWGHNRWKREKDCIEAMKIQQAELNENNINQHKDSANEK